MEEIKGYDKWLMAPYLDDLTDDELINEGEYYDY
jgi:hypothetical protein